MKMNTKDKILYFDKIKLTFDKSKSYNRAKSKKEKANILLNMLDEYMGAHKYVYEFIYERANVYFSWNMILKHLIIILALLGIFNWCFFIPAFVFLILKIRVKVELKHYICCYFEYKHAYKLEDNGQTTE